MAYTKRELKNLLGGEVEDSSAIKKAWDFLMSKLPPSQQATVDRLLAEQNKKDWDSMGERLDLEGISQKFAKDSEERDNDYYSGLLASDELELYDDSPDKQDKLDISDSVDESMYGFDSENQDPIRQNEREMSALSAPTESSSPASKMSPQAKTAMVGLLKDFLTPAPDDPPTQVRSAGISRGSTPFPSLLQKRPERKYYQNKGLG